MHALLAYNIQNARTYIHAYIHTYIHTCIRTDMHMSMSMCPDAHAPCFMIVITVVTPVPDH